MEWKLGGGRVFLNNMDTLKPSLVEWKHVLRAPAARFATTLETFLGGMETGYSREVHTGLYTLKPSLVEWKQVAVDSGAYPLLP